MPQALLAAARRGIAPPGHRPDALADWVADKTCRPADSDQKPDPVRDGEPVGDCLLPSWPCHLLGTACSGA